MQRLTGRNLLLIGAWLVVLIAAVTAASTIDQDWLAYVVVAILGVGVAWWMGWEWLLALGAIIAIAVLVQRIG